MLYYKNNKIYTLNEIRREMPNICIPENVSIQKLEQLGFILVEDIKPEYNTKIQYLNPVGVIIIENKPIQQYEIINLPLSDFKTSKLSEISASFINFFQNGQIESSLGFIADCRRYGDKNDLQNIQGLIDLYTKPVPFKSADGSIHILNLEQLNILKTEIIQRAQTAYANKWMLEAAVEASETIEEIEAINVEI